MFDKLAVWLVELISLLLSELSYMPIMRPVMVTGRAISLVIIGIVMVIEDVGGMFMVRLKPGEMLPKANDILG